MVTPTLPRPRWLTTRLLIIVLLLLQISIVLSSEEHALDKGPKSRHAYLTLLNSDEEFVSGVRVLAQSIRDTGTKADIMVIVTEQVSPQTRLLLARDGIRVKAIESIRNPHEDHYYFKTRLLFAFSKINMFNQVEYDRIIYLDADTIVTTNIDVLFKCGEFCAVLRGAFFNTGVMVLKPMAERFDAMHAEYRNLPSYNGGEQGFMNSFFPDFEFCAFFNDKNPDPHGVNRNCTRLPTYYNGDIGAYYLHDAHWITGSVPPVLHFTLGPFKPWQWWSYLVIDLGWIWHGFYEKLPPNPNSHAYETFLILAVIPMITTAAIAWFASSKYPLHRTDRETTRHSSEMHRFPILATILFALFAAGFSLLAPFKSFAPLEFEHPYQGWFVLFEWQGFIFIGLLMLYLHGLQAYLTHGLSLHLPFIISNTKLPLIVMRAALWHSMIWIMILIGTFFHLLINVSPMTLVSHGIQVGVVIAVFVLYTYFRLTSLICQHLILPSHLTNL